MRSMIFVGLLAGLLAGVLTTQGCDTRECRGLADCGLDLVCSRDGRCVEKPPPGPGIPPGDGGPIGGEGEGEGEGNVRRLIQTFEPINMFVPGALNEALVSIGGLPPLNFDEMRSFNVNTGALASTPRFNFTNGDPRCGLDTIRELDANLLRLNNGDETWFSCANGVQVDYEVAGFAQRYVDPGIPSVELAVLLPSNDGSRANAQARLLVARRGAPVLTEVIFNRSTDNVRTARATTALPFSFSRIMAIYRLTRGSTVDPQLGDLLLVFDKPDPPAKPRLYPIQRRFGQDNWQEAGGETQIRPIDLPVGTHFAHFREDIGIRDLTTLQTNEADNDTANIILTLPTTDGGVIRFLRYEVEQLSGEGQSNFRDLRLNASDPNRIAIPDARDRVLFVERRIDGEVEYLYSLTNSNHVWRFPLHVNRNDDRTNDVLRAQFNNQADRPIGIVAFPPNPNRVWVAMGNREIIELLDFNTAR
jgi:hypothetical protein